MSEETMGRHVERRTLDAGKQHWNLCLRDLPSMVLQSSRPVGRNAYTGSTFGSFRNGQLPSFGSSRWRTSLGVFSREPTSWPLRSVAVRCQSGAADPHRAARYQLALVGGADARQTHGPAVLGGDRQRRQTPLGFRTSGQETVEELLQRYVEEEGVRIWQNGEPVALWDWELCSLCWRFHRPVRIFKER